MKILCSIIISFLFSMSVFASLPELGAKEEKLLQEKLKYTTYKKVKTFKLTMDHFYAVKPYQTYEVELTGTNPQDGADYKIPLTYFKSTQTGKRPLMLIFPAIFGATSFDYALGMYMANKGFHVLILDLPEDINNKERPIKDVEGFLVRTTAAARSAIDFAMEQAEIDSERVGAFGVSLGGIRLGVTMGIDKRIKAGFFAVAGGNIPEIIAYSQEVHAKPWREHRMKLEGFKNEVEVCDYVKKNNLIDPLYLAKNIPRENVYFLLSDMDASVPTKNQIELMTAFGTPNHRYMGLPHMFAGAYSYFLTDKIFLSLLDPMLENLEKKAHAKEASTASSTSGAAKAGS